MKLRKGGKNISQAEVLEQTATGIWLGVNRKEFFLPHKQYPWFGNKRLQDIKAVRLLGRTHLYWPRLDVDLDLDAIKNPEKYPLRYR